MTAHQRRPGFRLPWSSESEQPAGDSAEAQAETPGAASTETPAEASAPASSPDASGAEQQSGTDAPTTGSPDEMGEHAASESATAADASQSQPHDSDQETAGMTVAAAPQTTAQPEPEAAPTGFIGDLLTAMRRVAEEARDSTLAELRQRAEDAARDAQARADERREELRAKAEADIAGVGEWAKAEAERIKAEAEQRVAARRAELDRQLAREESRQGAEADAVKSRVEAYERELDAFHQQLAAITDPAAFAAAVKRMPTPPALDGSGPVAAAEPAAAMIQPEPPQQAEAAPETQQQPATDTVGETKSADEPAATDHGDGTNGSAPSTPVASEDGAAVAATELDKVEPTAQAGPAGEDTLAEPVATEIVVKGLGSFGAITGFRQQLAAVEGIDAVGLSLGSSGEFVFRATHRPSLDLAAAITSLEGDGVEIAPRAEGGLRVTLGRPR